VTSLVNLTRQANIQLVFSFSHRDIIDADLFIHLKRNGVRPGVVAVVIVKSVSCCHFLTNCETNCNLPA
jgi:hypothetical protein